MFGYESCGFDRVSFDVWWRPLLLGFSVRAVCFVCGSRAAGPEPSARAVRLQCPCDARCVADRAVFAPGVVAISPLCVRSFCSRPTLSLVALQLQCRLPKFSDSGRSSATALRQLTLLAWLHFRFSNNALLCRMACLAGVVYCRFRFLNASA